MHDDVDEERVMRLRMMMLKDEDSPANAMWLTWVTPIFLQFQEDMDMRESQNWLKTYQQNCFKKGMLTFCNILVSSVKQQLTAN